MHELIIIGAGPAGLTAAIYGARAGLETLVLERLSAGGQIAETSEVENYPGFLSVGGAELAEKMRAQALYQGAVIRSATVTALRLTENGWALDTSRGETLEARAVIAAMGASRRKLGVAGERELAGVGVSYCATCDGGFFKGREVAVVGGGSTAFEDALYLARICSKVYLIHRREGFRAEKKLIDEAENAPNIELILNTVVESIGGNGVVEHIDLRNVQSGETTRLPVSGVFVAVGTVPNTSLLSGLVPLDDYGFALVDEHLDAGNGLYVAGDIRKKSIYQIVSAVSDGAVAASAAASYLV